MKFKLLFIFVLLSTFLYAKEFPRTFSQLANPLYSSVKHFNKYKDIPALTVDIEKFQENSKKILLMGYQADKIQTKKFMVAYLKELRKLQKQYEVLLHTLHKSIEKSIDNDEYNLFIKLTSYSFEGLFKNTNLLNKAMHFYNKNRWKHSCKVLDKMRLTSQLIKKTEGSFNTEIVESSYNSNSTRVIKKKVHIEISRVKNKIYIKFVNTNIYDVTLHVVPKYQNIKFNKNIKNEFVIAAKSSYRYDTLKLLSGKSYYSYKYSWTMGAKNISHNDSYLYKLPYKQGTSHIVSQGYNGLKTHKGRSAYSIDFSMPEGTKIYAARDGIVVKIKQNSNIGGYDKKFSMSGNFVRILHDDGTFATYYHLQYRGVLVVVGEKVSQGEAIAYSGNTGYSSGPHLHFSVFKAANANHTKTIPIKIVSKEGIITQPQKGHYYTAK